MTAQFRVSDHPDSALAAPSEFVDDLVAVVVEVVAEVSRVVAVSSVAIE